MPRQRPSKARIIESLKERVAPLMALDNGSVETIRYIRKGGRVQVRFSGSYKGSPCRKTLAEHVVKPVLNEIFTGIKSVEYVD